MTSKRGERGGGEKQRGWQGRAGEDRGGQGRTGEDRGEEGMGKEARQGRKKTFVINMCFSINTRLSTNQTLSKAN